MSDTLKQIADNLGVTTINGNYLSGIADYYGVDLTTSTDLMRDILVEVGGDPSTSTDYLQDIVLELGGTVTINGNWMEAWEAITAVPALFTTEWTTTANSETITLPYSAGTYSGTIDWGDGSTDINDGSVTTHTYATAGTYTVIITGDCTGWYFGTYGGSTYLTSVVNWGQLQLGPENGGYNFYACPNLDLSSVSDVLDLTGITDLYYMFGGCTSLTNINRIGEWDTSAITNMNAMFQLCTLINFNIGTWDVGNVSNFTDFMDSATTTFSTTNLDAIYNGWSASGVQPACSITFGTAEYTVAGGQAGKDILISVLNNWTIIDGGGI